MPRVLIVGGTGLLGAALSKHFRDSCPECELLVPARRDFDVSDLARVSEFLARVEPDIVVNCAAFTDVDAAERIPSEALVVNAIGVRNLAVACREALAHLIHVSTDYVFAGSRGTPISELALPNPSSVYGLSKMMGEQWALDILGSKLSIVRTSWLFAAEGKSFVARFAQAAKEERSISVEATCFSIPTSVTDLASQLVALAELVLEGTDKETHGIFHFTNSGQATKFDVACHVYSLLDVDPAKVTAVSWKEIPHAAQRPEWSCLADNKSSGLGLTSLPAWNLALRTCLVGT